MLPKRFEWQWYIGRENEVLIDFDSDDEVREGLFYARGKLRRSWNREFLRWESIHLYRSMAACHCHMFITLEEPMRPIQRAMWGLFLGSDKIRAMYTVMRIDHGLGAADLLIADRAYPGFREPDYTCACPGKHNEDRITKNCPVFRSIHGDQAGIEYFPVNNDRKDRMERFEWPVGLVPLSKILKS